MSRESLPFLVLAAGASSRMGRPKPLLELGGRTLLARALWAAHEGGAAPLLVVARDPEELRSRAGRLPAAEWVTSPEAHRGQSYSLRVGLRAAARHQPRAVLVGLSDQVGLRPEAVAAVQEAVAQGGSKAWSVAYGGDRTVPGHPVALGPTTWPLVEQLRGDRGAGPILAGLGRELRWVDLPATWRPVDCDTEEDYQALVAADLAAARTTSGDAG
jgi:CTP:molybdopterin cytidylyltransferase MocA